MGCVSNASISTFNKSSFENYCFIFVQEGYSIEFGYRTASNL